MAKQDYKKQLNDCRVKIENQRREIRRLQQINDTLGKGNIYGAFKDIAQSFIDRWLVISLYFSRQCPCCKKELSVKALFHYDKKLKKHQAISLELKEIVGGYGLDSI